MLGSGLFAALLLALSAGRPGSSEPPKPSTVSWEEARRNGVHVSAINPREEAKDKLALDAIGWEHSDGGLTLLINFKLTNGNAFAVKDLKVHCTGYAPSGTAIDSNDRVIYRLFPAHHTTRVSQFNMGFLNSQVASVACGLVDFRYVGEGL